MGPDAPDAAARYHPAAEEFAVECSIVKVVGSETYSRMTDEAIQIHGGYGYTENFPAARAPGAPSGCRASARGPTSSCGGRS